MQSYVIHEHILGMPIAETSETVMLGCSYHMEEAKVKVWTHLNYLGVYKYSQ